MKTGMLIAAGTAVLLLGAGPALATGPTGSTETKPCPATKAQRDAGLGAEPGSSSCAYNPQTGQLAPSGQRYESNDVTCGRGATTTPPNDLGITAGANERGAEVCNPGSLVVFAGDQDVRAGLEGRVTVSAEKQYAAIDGDRDNPHDGLTGWARVDGSGVSCSRDGGSTDAARKSNETVADCNPAG